MSSRRSAETNGDDRLVIFVAPNIRQTSYAVFFHDDRPTAYGERTHDADLRRTAIAKPAAATAHTLKLEKVDLTADDGTKIPALHVVGD